MRTDNRTTKQKLIDLVSALQNDNIIDYFYTFTALKLYGLADCPDGHVAEVCEMWEKHMKPRIEKQEQERHEQTAEEKRAGEYRCSITRMLYDIENLAILNYIRIIVEDVAKEDSGTGRSRNYKDLIIKMVLSMNNENYLFKTYHYLLAKYRREKGGAV